MPCLSTLMHFSCSFKQFSNFFVIKPFFQKPNKEDRPLDKYVFFFSFLCRTWQIALCALRTFLKLRSWVPFINFLSYAAKRLLWYVRASIYQKYRASKRVLGLGRRHTIDHRPYIKEVITWPAFAFYYFMCFSSGLLLSSNSSSTSQVPWEFPSKCKTCLVGNSRNERAACTTHKFHFLYARKIAAVAV